MRFFASMVVMLRTCCARRGAHLGAGVAALGRRARGRAAVRRARHVPGLGRPGRQDPVRLGPAHMLHVTLQCLCCLWMRGWYVILLEAGLIQQLCVGKYKATACRHETLGACFFPGAGWWARGAMASSTGMCATMRSHVSR